MPDRPARMLAGGGHARDRFVAVRSSVSNLTRNRSRLRKQTRAHFRTDLDALPDAERNALTNSITALMAMETIEVMRHDQGLSKRATLAALRTSLRRLLAPEAT